VNDLAQRNLILEDDTVAGPVLQLFEHAAAILRELHHRPDISGRDDDRQPHERLGDGLDRGGIGKQRRVVDLDGVAPLELYAVLDGGRRRDELQLELALQALLHDLEVEQAQESASKAKSQRGRILRLVRKRAVVELQLLERLLQVRELV